jgi:hypothetical protein
VYGFLIPLLVGFALAGASAFTAVYSQRWGERGGQLATSILRNFLGIPPVALRLHSRLASACTTAIELE